MYDMYNKMYLSTFSKRLIFNINVINVRRPILADSTIVSL